MLRFRAINWLEVVQAFDESARLIRWTQEMVEFSVEPYGHIEIFDNGGEVNIFWLKTPELNLNLPEHQLQVWQFQLGYSLPLQQDAKKMASSIKNAVDNAITIAVASQPILYLPCAEHRPEEVQVVRQRYKDGFVVSTRKPGKLWLVLREWAELHLAVTDAMSLYDFPSR